jgi:hypothetical protein
MKKNVSYFRRNQQNGFIFRQFFLYILCQQLCPSFCRVLLNKLKCRGISQNLFQHESHCGQIKSIHKCAGKFTCTIFEVRILRNSVFCVRKIVLKLLSYMIWIQNCTSQNKVDILTFLCDVSLLVNVDM